MSIGDYQLNESEVNQGRKWHGLHEGWERGRTFTWKANTLAYPPDEIVEEFKRQFPHKRNKDLCELVKHGVSYVSALGNYLGLKKTQEFYDKVSAKGLKASLLPLSRRKNRPPKGVLPPNLKDKCFGTPGAYKHPKEWFEKTREERSKARKELIAKERMRYLAGLPLQTNLKNIKPRNENSYRRRHRLKKRGYVEVEHNIYVYDENTKRCPKIEKDKTRPQRCYSKEEWQAILEKRGQHVTAIQDWKDRQGGFANS